MEPKNLAISRFFSRRARNASEIYLRASEKTAGELRTGLGYKIINKDVGNTSL